MSSSSSEAEKNKSKKARKPQAKPQKKGKNKKPESELPPGAKPFEGYTVDYDLATGIGYWAGKVTIYSSIIMQCPIDGVTELESTVGEVSLSLFVGFFSSN